MLDCPVCSHLLEPIHYQSTLIHSCSAGCGGLWLDQQTLDSLSYQPRLVERMHATTQAGFQALVHSHLRKCPNCKQALEAWLIQSKLSQANSSVEIDSCNQCQGIWLDHGELQSLILIQRQSSVQRIRSGHPKHRGSSSEVVEEIAEAAIFIPEITEVTAAALPATAELAAASTEVVASGAAGALELTGSVAEAAAGGIGEVLGGIADLFGGLFG